MQPVKEYRIIKFFLPQVQFIFVKDKVYENDASGEIDENCKKRPKTSTILTAHLTTNDRVAVIERHHHAHEHKNAWNEIFLKILDFWVQITNFEAV